MHGPQTCIVCCPPHPTQCRSSPSPCVRRCTVHVRWYALKRACGTHQILPRGSSGLNPETNTNAQRILLRSRLLHSVENPDPAPASIQMYMLPHGIYSGQWKRVHVSSHTGYNIGWSWQYVFIYLRNLYTAHN